MATGAYTGNPNIARQGARARQIAQARNVSDIADPRTFQKDDSRFTKWHSYQVEIFGIKYESELLRDVKEFIDLQMNKIE